MGTQLLGNLNNNGQQKTIVTVTPDPILNKKAGAVIGPGQPTYARNANGGTVASGPGTPLGNPNWPCAAGPEVLPSEQAKLPLDTGTAYIFQHYVNQASVNGSLSRVAVEFDANKNVQQHFVSHDLYLNQGSITNQLQPTRLVLPLRTAVSSGGFTLVGGATSPQCLANPGDGKYVSLDALTAGKITVSFDPTALQTNWGNADNTRIKGRIVGLALRYVAWKDDASEAVPGEGFKIQVNDTTTGSLCEIGSYLVNEYQNNAVFNIRDLGETNPISRGLSDFPSRILHCWTVEDLQMMGVANNDGSLNNRIFFVLSALQGDITQTVVNFDYIEMVVDVLPEQRLACGVRNVSNARSDTTANTGAWDKDCELRHPLSSAFAAALPPTTQDDMFLVVREARPADVSDYYRAKTVGTLQVAPMESYGPSLQILGVVQTRSADQLPDRIGQLQTYTSAVINDQVEAATLTSFTEYRMAITHYLPSTLVTYGSFFAAYRDMMPFFIQRIYTGQSRVQRVWLKGGVSYDRVRALIQATPLVIGGVQIAIYDNSFVFTGAATAIMSKSYVESTYTDQGNGWREIAENLSSPVTPVSDSYYYIIISSNTPEGQPWLVSGAEPLGLKSYFSYDVPGDATPFGTNSNIEDYSMVLCCSPGTPTAPSVSPAIVPLTYNSCGLVNLTINQVSWTSDGNWDQYVVVYNTSLDPSLKTAGNIVTAGPAGTPHTMYVSDMPWDITVQYALVGHRGFDLSETLGAFSPGTIVASNAAKLGISRTLGIDDPGYLSAVYVPTSESDLDISWEYLTQIEKVYLHGENGARNLSPVEDRGRAFTVQLAVEHLAACVGATLNTLTVGQRSLDGSGFDLVQTLARQAAVRVQFPGGAVGRYIMELGSMHVITNNGLYLVEVTFTPRAPTTLNVLGANRTTR